MADGHTPDLVRAHEDRMEHLETTMAAAAQERREDLRELRQDRQKMAEELEQIRAAIHRLDVSVLKQVSEIRDRMIDDLVSKVGDATRSAKRAHERLDDHGSQLKNIRDSQNRLAIKVAILVAFLMGTGFLTLAKLLPL